MGVFKQFPSNITVEERVVAVAKESVFNVIKERTIVSMETFNDILKQGKIELVLKFLREKNLLKGDMGFTMESILWLL